jgi:ATP-binding cassette, subfamily B, bacterial
MSINSSIQSIDIKRLTNNRSKRVVFSQKSDMTIDRQFGESVLVITETELLNISNEKIINEYLLDNITDVSIDELVGGGRVCVESEGEKHQVLYYSNHFAPLFAETVRCIGQYLKDRSISQIEESYASICCKCNAPLPERGARCPRCVPKFKILLRILELALPYRSKIIVLMLVTALGVLFQVAPPYLTKKIVDEVIAKGNHGLLIYYTGAMVGTGLLYLTMRLIVLRLTTWISAHIVSDLRCKLHSSIQFIKLKYLARRETGELIGRVMYDTGELQQFLVEGMPFLLINSISFIVVAVILMKISFSLTLLVFIPVPILIIGSSWFWQKLHPLFLRQGSIIGHLHSVLSESIQGLRAIKACSREKQRISIFNSVNEQLADTQIKTQRIFGSFNEVMFFIMSIGVSLVWFFAVKLIIRNDHTLTMGDLLAFVGYIWLFYGPLQWYSVILNWMTHAFSGAERIFEIIDTASEEDDNVKCVIVPEIKGKITFDNVHFSYEQGKEIIKGISFTIKSGEIVGLIGKSGAGKSTIIQLLTRFFAPDSGEILVDDIPLHKIKLSQLRKSMGIVLQDPFLFNGTIAENIAFGSDTSTFKDVVEASRAAYAHEFIIRKPEGYDTLIGDSGVRLSGGEKQRIAIARAILYDPPILILDEATSSVDTTTEQYIQSAIAKLIQGRTTIAIAHRLSTLRNAHRLIVLEDGKIAESGSHEELVMANGIYSEMVKSYSKTNNLQSLVWGE